MSDLLTTRLVRVVTARGDLLIELDGARAPLSAAAFLRCVDEGRYAGGAFVRTVNAANDRGSPTIAVVQAFAKDLQSTPTVAHESTRRTGLAHLDATVSLPRSSGSDGSPLSFIVCIGDQPGLDAGTERIADREGFAAFGRVVDGMDVAREIHLAPTQAGAPIEYLQDQMIAEPIAIFAARREPATAAAKLAALSEDYWAFRNHEFPIEASFNGVPGHGDRLDRVSVEDHERRARVAARMLRRLDAICAAELREEDADTYALLRGQLELLVASWQTGACFVPQLFLAGFQAAPQALVQSMPLTTGRDIEDLLSRLEAIPEFFGSNLDVLEEGVRRGYRVPRPLIGRVRETLAATLADSGLRRLLRLRLERAPSGVTADAMDALRERAERALSTAALPALRAFDEFLATNAERISMDSTSACDQPNGEAYYRFRVAQQTTTSLSPDEIHRIGLDAVARIREEIQAVLDTARFRGSPREYAAMLDARVEPTAESLLTRTRALAKHIDGRLPRVIGTLPRAAYTVESLTPEQSVALPPGLADPAPPDSGMASVYWITALPARCPNHLLVPLGLHEAWPGHLMQFALAHELASLPAFRRAAWMDCNGYVEGWALYCEWLGHDLGLYEDPADHFGRLTFDLWRAARLVVDTGLHWYRWERSRAIEYMVDCTYMPRATIETEVDRYIGMPAQALSYKIGERAIRLLRAEAEAQLGERFDIRGFHDALLATGPVTLDVVAGAVRRWIDARRTAKGVAA